MYGNQRQIKKRETEMVTMFPFHLFITRTCEMTSTQKPLIPSILSKKIKLIFERNPLTFPFVSYNFIYNVYLFTFT